MKICAILVLYNPDLELLKRVLNAVVKQNLYTIIIDNSTRDFSKEIPLNIDNYRYLPLLKNCGIAAAQNMGIKFAKDNDFNFVVFFDQDSVPDKNFIKKMSQAYYDIQKFGYKIGAIGPRSISRETGRRYKAKFSKGSKINERPYTSIGQIISSGSLVAIETFDTVGDLKEDMFIDLVDFEWCWRALDKGYSHFIVENTYLEHMFGGKEWRVLSFRVTVPSAFRIYYQFRNYLWMIDKGYVPVYWKISNAAKLMVKLVFLPIICKEHITYLKRSFKGITHGLFRKKG